ncbi:MAG: glycosyltransferase family 2 protein [Rhodospirillales bacterium]|nr:glycosyltransferase family 2 protein [Rhodospirillales bacterium]
MKNLSVIETSDDQVLISSNEAIKLVIWDLDETFWRGTLSEGEIVPIQDNIELVKALSARGIVNSICSKNHFAPARETLINLGIWEHFVFPRIAFLPKGKLISEIIEAAQLRAPSILFVDDNITNLNEALHYNPGLQVSEPMILASLLNDPRCIGKPDPSQERLSRYKILEQKQSDQIATGGDNTEFLRNSRVRISLHDDVINQFSRVHDLVNRTNQLNFTKQRWPEGEAEAKRFAEKEFNAAFNSHWGYVKVADRYGNYGICGFYLIREARAIHFAFSCRAMNMGVEQFVWNKLARPHIHISGEVSSSLHDDYDWITLVDDADAADNNEHLINQISQSIIGIWGGCDLSMMAHYLRMQHSTVEEYQYPYQDWGIHRVARSVALFESVQLPKVKSLLKQLPGMPEDRFDSILNSLQADIYVLSFSSEGCGGLYKSKSTGLIFHLNCFSSPRTDFKTVTYDELLEKSKGKTKISQSQWEFIKAEFEFLSERNDTLLCADISKIFEKLAGKKVIVLGLNENVGSSHWILKCFKEINDVVLPLAKSYGVEVVHMNEFVKSTQDLADLNDPGTHYSRKVYADLSNRISDICSTTLAASGPKMKIIAVTRVLNESDVIEAFVRHTSSYVDHHYIMDNGSHDGTVRILEALANEGLPITVFQSRSVTYNEADSVTFLYREACKQTNPDWVLCLDCDEFLDDRLIMGGLRKYLASIHYNQDITCINIPMVSYVVTELDNDKEELVTKRMTRRIKEISDWPWKVLIRTSVDSNLVEIENGSHFVKHQGQRLTGILLPGLYLAHYAERSVYQYFSKIVRGWSKVLATGASEIQKKTAIHYKGNFDRLKWNPELLVRDKHFMEFKKSSQNFVEDPIEYKGGLLKYTPQNDELVRSIRSLMGFLEHCMIQHGRILDQFPDAREEVRRWESETIKIIETKTEPAK